MAEYFCTECGSKCSPFIEDIGIGYYEYWGATGFDSKIVVSSNCCEASVVDEFGNNVSPEQVRERNEELDVE